MSNWSLGSFADEMYVLTPDIPTGLSGTPMQRMADRTRINVERWTGYTIGNSEIDEKYQPAILVGAQLELLANMQLVGADANNLKLGDWSMSKGSSSNLTVTMGYLQKKYDFELQKLGFGTRFFKANG